MPYYAAFSPRFFRDFPRGQIEQARLSPSSIPMCTQWLDCAYTLVHENKNGLGYETDPPPPPPPVFSRRQE